MSNTLDHIFGRFKREKSELITTTINQPESIDMNSQENDVTATSVQCCFLPTLSLFEPETDTNSCASNHESKPQHKHNVHCEKQTQCRRFIEHQHNHNRIRNPQNKLNEISIFSVYLFLVTLFVCICTIAVLLFIYINRANDIVQLRESLSSEYIGRSEIDELIRNVLQEMDNNDDGSFNMDSNGNINNNAINFSKVFEVRPGNELPQYGYINGADDNGVGNKHRIFKAAKTERKPSPMLNTMRKRRAANENFVAGTQNNVKGPFVEFFNPKMRRELEKKDEEIKRTTGMKGAAPGGDDWAYLTSFSRIPYEAISGFCSATKDYCPPGTPGSNGQHGTKGYRGDIGMPGPPGREGPIGPRGPKGVPGSPGLDGRDGIPGEPGLDGVPGRAGADGIPGKDARDGIPGVNGKNGIDGKDGKEGLPGPQGPMGERGDRGRSGRPGQNGIPGQPGISTYKYTSLETGKLLIPPSISDVPNKPIIVIEDSFLRLRCAASGHPKPTIVWSRLDGRPISDGSWQVSSVQDSTINITHVNRIHNGFYMCVANNGIPPHSNATFQVEVHFPPLIRVRNQFMYAFEGGSVSLECETEAFPEPLKFWKRRSDNRILDQNEKFRMGTYTDGYKSTMRLNITDVRSEDFGEYECVSKNDINTTSASFYIYDGARHPTRTYSDLAIFGTLPPKLISYGDLCSLCPRPNCDELRCNNDVEVKKLHLKNIRGITNRTSDYVLYAVGKPVYHKSINITYGSWMKDSSPSKGFGEKIWTTNLTHNTIINEFADKSSFRNNDGNELHLNSPGFQGNAHVIYSSSFYYHQKDSPVIVRFDLERREAICNVTLPDFQWSGDHYLYTTKCNYVDLNADENGLWAIYSSPSTSNTYVVKLDASTLEITYGLNVSINHNKVGEMFIVGGVLYAIDSVTDRNAKIHLALDFYRGYLLNDINLSFTNPFKNTTMASYNPQTKELFTWDHGNQLTYPIRYNEMTKYESQSERNEETQSTHINTGYDNYE